MKQLVVPETETQHAMYLVHVDEDGVAALVNGVRHFMPWPLVQAAAAQQDEDLRAVYSALRDAAFASLSPSQKHAVRHPHGTLEGKIAALRHEGRRARDLGDVVRAGEVARTIDELAGVRIAGQWIGGWALLDGVVTPATLAAAAGSSAYREAWEVRVLASRAVQADPP